MATDTSTNKGRVFYGDGQIICRVDFSKTPVNTADTYVLAQIPAGFIPRNVCVNVVEKTAAACVAKPAINGNLLATDGFALGAVATLGGASGTVALIAADTNLTATFSAAATAGKFDIVISGDNMLKHNDVAYVRDRYTGSGDPWPACVKQEKGE